MFVYQGKLKWFSYAQDETFVIVLPNGFARDGDTAYVFSQWTEDAQKRKKSNFFQTLVVSGLAKHPNGNDCFILKGVYYTWHIETQQVYGKLSVTMSNPQKDKSTMTVDRIWQSKGEQDTGNVRIWTGKFNWLEFANNEPAIFIVPDGFGNDKPILSLWQWTKDSKGQTKAPSFREAVQKEETGAGDGLYKFSYNSYYDITCTWDEKTEKLSVHMKEGSNLQHDVAQLNLSAKIERERPGHAHSFNAPLAAPEKKELDTRLPQAQASLRRLLNPLPFPGTLIETMEHTAAFLDQAGYLARYAQDRYTALDSDYHLQLQLVEALKKDKVNLKDQIKTLNDILRVSNATAIELQQQLDDAKAAAKETEDELRKQIAELQKHGVTDHKILEDLHKKLHAALDTVACLEKDFSAVKIVNKELLTRIKTLQADVKALEEKKLELENALKKQKDANGRLTKANAELTKEKNALEKAKNDLQTKLAAKEAELAKTRADLKKTTEQRDKAQTELELTKDDLKDTKDTLAEREGDKTKLKLALETVEENEIKARQDLNVALNKATAASRTERKVHDRMEALEELLKSKKIPFDHIPKVA